MTSNSSYVQPLPFMITVLRIDMQPVTPYLSFHGIVSNATIVVFICAVPYLGSCQYSNSSYLSTLLEVARRSLLYTFRTLHSTIARGWITIDQSLLDGLNTKVLVSDDPSRSQVIEMQQKIESTVIGLKYPTGRDRALKTGTNWLKGKQQDDGAEGLWRVADKLYDLEEWARNHPGGEEWISLTRGTDITEAFEAHHVSLLAERLLPKFYIRDAVQPRACPLTFKPDGFYRKFKARTREALKDVNFHKSSRTSNLIADSLFAVTFALCLTASATQSWIAIVASGIFLTWTTVSAHNFFHQRDSFRMYYFDLSLMSSKEWRITHALSHHLYTNTLLDIEISMFEPFFQYLPTEDKSIITRYLSKIYFPLIYTTMFFGNAIKRIYSILWEWSGPEIRDLVPFLIPTLMCFAASPASALVTWLKIVAVSSFYFALIGLNAAHHHPDIYHDGDVRREDTDWGLASVDAVRDRVEIESSIFLVLTHFGTHTLHHLLPTVDHAYLYLCEPAFVETCKEFGVDTELWTQWNLVKGQFEQLGNHQPKKTPNTR